MHVQYPSYYLLPGKEKYVSIENTHTHTHTHTHKLIHIQNCFTFYCNDNNKATNSCCFEQNKITFKLTWVPKNYDIQENYFFI